MIFNQQVIFIHIGKTGGMSCADYLLNNLAPTVYNCHAGALNEPIPHDESQVVALNQIGRHCTLSEALAFIKDYDGRAIEDFDKVVAVIRNPYTLEFSYYQHLRKPHVMARRLKEAKPQLIDLAQGEFRDFVTASDFHREGVSPDGYFQLAGKIHPKVELVRFEELAHSLARATADYRRSGPEHPMPHRNKSEHRFDLDTMLDEELEERIYQKHRYMFDSGLYQRLR